MNTRKLFRRAGWVALAIGVVALSACGGDSAAPASDVADEVVQAQEEVLNTFAVGTQKITFLKSGAPGAADDEAALVMQVEGLQSDGDLVAAAEREGRLTMLELFNALAPKAMAPHPALTRSHAREALELGRAETRLKTASGIARPLDGPTCSPDPCPPIPYCATADNVQVLPFPQGLNFTTFTCATNSNGSGTPSAGSCPQNFTPPVSSGLCVAPPRPGTQGPPPINVASYNSGYKTTATGGRVRMTLGAEVRVNSGAFALRRFTRGSSTVSHNAAAIGGRLTNTNLLISYGTSVD